MANNCIIFPTGLATNDFYCFECSSFFLYSPPYMHAIYPILYLLYIYLQWLVNVLEILGTFVAINCAAYILHLQIKHIWFHVFCTLHAFSGASKTYAYTFL